ncbi:MAG TPA: tRNA (guanosine(46)-N7)-methyltransferase TrmB [Immundisolibacter sp.]|nr:tRNA (guanosine(46)-N7)-methyltransferase TrmB [Immundisolibacter sp.]
MPEASHRRAIRSFVVRAGRMTPGQRQALERLWPRYGLDLPDGAIDLDQAFGRQAPRTLEIGFGMGDALLALATGHPEQDFIGVEVYPPGVGSFLQRVEQAGLANVRVICADAIDVLASHLPAASLDRLLVLFPDPWPKKRHHKRRLVNAPFLGLAARVLRSGGQLQMATDWADYAAAIGEALLGSPDFEPSRLPADGAGRPETKYERRGQRLGHDIHEFRVRRR